MRFACYLIRDLRFVWFTVGLTLLSAVLFKAIEQHRFPTMNSFSITKHISSANATTNSRNCISNLCMSSKFKWLQLQLSWSMSWSERRMPASKRGNRHQMTILIFGVGLDFPCFHSLFALKFSQTWAFVSCFLTMMEFHAWAHSRRSYSAIEKRHKQISFPAEKRNKIKLSVGKKFPALKSWNSSVRKGRGNVFSLANALFIRVKIIFRWDHSRAVLTALDLHVRRYWSLGPNRVVFRPPKDYFSKARII